MNTFQPGSGGSNLRKIAFTDDLLTKRFIRDQRGSLSTKVELALSCRSLRNLDTFSKSDPFVVLFEDNQGHWVNF